MSEKIKKELEEKAEKLGMEEELTQEELEKVTGGTDTTGEKGHMSCFGSVRA